MMKTIQRVELLKHYDASIHCPFCGAKVVNMEEGTKPEDMCVPCPHTLFVANDEGFEYRSKRFDDDVGIADVPDAEVEFPEGGCDELTDRCTIADSLKIASYVGAPSGLGSYVGFAPLED